MSGAPDQPLPVVTVFASSDWAEITMAKLLLQSEGIRFVTEGEGVQDLFGWGRSFGGYNPLTGPIQLRVAAEEVNLALDALRELRLGLDTPE